MKNHFILKNHFLSWRRVIFVVACIFPLFVFAFAHNHSVQAVTPQVVALDTVTLEQNFNELDDSGTFTADSLSSGSPLTNSGSSNTGGPGLDFTTFWFDTRGTGTGPKDGGESGDFIGVNSYAGSNAPDVAADGTPVTPGSEHNFEFNDGDGQLDLVFETVDASSLSNPVVSFDYWINDTGYESTDAFFVTVDDGTTSQTFLNFSEAELEANASADDGTANWNSAEINLSGFDLTQITLTISADTNSGSENIIVDNITFADGGTTPPPTGQPLPLTEGFDSCALTGWEIISVDADTSNTWECNDFFSNIEANGFGDSAPANEWLITPPLDMDAQENDTLRFRSFTGFSDSGIPYPQVKVQYSTDYTGNSDPTSATWTEITGINFSPAGSFDWADSGIIDLSGISGDTVYFAFQYQSSGTGGGSAALWRLDGINFASFIPVGECGDPVTHMIHEIQGVGNDGSAPLLGNTVVVEGVVVGDFQENDGDHTDLGGFFVQEEDSDADSNPLTSEGIFIFAPGAADVNAGDRVRIKGTVGEFFNMTQIGSVTDIVTCDPTSLPGVTDIMLPVTNTADLEAYEGMYVRFPQQLRISEYFNFDRFGEIVLTTDRQFQPTAVFEPGSQDAADLADLNNRSRITLDDGRTNQNPDPAIHPNGMEFLLSNRFRGGDIVQNATGVLNYAFGLYRIQPTQGADYTAVNLRPAAPADVGGTLKVASFNVLNYFNTIDTGADICGPLQNQGCRGADDVNERDRQLAKIVNAMATMDVDVLGIIEVENTAGVEAMVDIVAGLNSIFGSGTYDYIDTGTIGSDVIKVGFIYKTTTVTPVGNFAVLDTPEFVNPNTPGDPKNRPALAQTFMENANGAKVTVVVNHFKSKGSPCGPGDDDPEAGSCNLTRTLAAQELVDWLATDPTNSNDPDFLITGDLNAYDKEDPIDLLTAAGYTDLALAYNGEFAYSYVFDGQLGYLDYALSNASLTPQITGATEWHINTDEPDIIDYDTSFKKDAQDALYEPNAYRSSDHDPVIAGLDLNAPPTCDTAAPSIATLWPPNHQLVSIDIVGITDPEGDAFTLEIDSIFQDEPTFGLDEDDLGPDGFVVDGDTVELRAERDGESNGRVYYISFTATDAVGSNCSGEVQVSVAKSQGKNGAAVGDGPLYDATILP